MINPSTNATLAFNLAQRLSNQKNTIKDTGISVSAEKIAEPVILIKKPPVITLSPKNIAYKVSGTATVANEWTPKLDGPQKLDHPITKDALNVVPENPDIGPGCYGPRKTWAAAWREGWAALVDASKKMQEIAQQAADPSISEEKRAALSAEFKQIADDIIAFGHGLMNEVRPQLQASQVRFYHATFNFANFRIGNGDLSTAESAAKVAKQMDATVGRFDRYNTFMLSIHKSHISAGDTNWL